MKRNLVLACAMPLLISASASAFASGAQFRCTAVSGTSDYLRNTPGYGYASNQAEAARQALANCLSDNGSDPAQRCSIFSCEVVNNFVIHAQDEVAEDTIGGPVRTVEAFSSVNTVNADAPPGDCFYNSHGPGCPF